MVAPRREIPKWGGSRPSAGRDARGSIVEAGAPSSLGARPRQRPVVAPGDRPADRPAAKAALHKSFDFPGLSG
jgi:hypothetical protein